jgi:hypothetical protein
MYREKTQRNEEKEMGDPLISILSDEFPQSAFVWFLGAFRELVRKV